MLVIALCSSLTDSHTLSYDLALLLPSRSRPTRRKICCQCEKAVCGNCADAETAPRILECTECVQSGVWMTTCEDCKPLEWASCDCCPQALCGTHSTRLERPREDDMFYYCALCDAARCRSHGVGATAGGGLPNAVESLDEWRHVEARLSAPMAICPGCKPKITRAQGVAESTDADTRAFS